MDVGWRTLSKKPRPAGFSRGSFAVEVKAGERKGDSFDLLPNGLIRRERRARLRKLHRAAGLLLQDRSGLASVLVRAFGVSAVFGMKRGFVAVAAANDQASHRLTDVQDETGRARSDERDRQNQRQQRPSHDSPYRSIAPGELGPRLQEAKKQADCE